MKKLICLLRHNKMLMKINECNKEDFENDNQAIRVYTCKYCGDYVYARTRCVKAKVKEFTL